MRLVVVPPLFDLTLQVYTDHEVLDLNESFVERMSDVDSDDLFAKAARRILRRGEFDFARLRAIGVAMRMAPDPALRLAADDVELVDGTTQSSLDVRKAAAGTRLFDEEIEVARAKCAGRTAHILVETDQQLPAAVALVNALGAENVVLCGRFAAEHEQVLRSVAQVERWPPRWVLREEWGGRAHWVRRAADWLFGEPWVGWLEPSEVVKLPAVALRQCLGLTVTVARHVDWHEVTGTDGITVDLGQLTPAVELRVGAPGVSGAEVADTIDRLGDTLAGLSPFRLPVHNGWGLPVSPPDGHDLPRWVPFTVRGTAGPAVLPDLLGMVSRQVDLYPGRFAACGVLPSDQGMWERSATVVRDGAGAYVVNLRTGSAFRLHPRLAPVVEACEHGDTDVLTGLSGSVRTKLSALLAGAGVLRWAA